LARTPMEREKTVAGVTRVNKEDEDRFVVLVRRQKPSLMKLCHVSRVAR